MTPEQQRIAIAETCGWKITETAVTYPNGLVIGFHPPEYVREVFLKACPDYLNDLNAMHAAVMSLPDRNAYLRELQIVTADWKNDPEDDHWLDRMTDATAAQRAKAFLKALNLWQP